MSLPIRLIAAGVDLSLVRDLISECLEDIEHSQPRIASAVDFLSAAFNSELSPYPRMLCPVTSRST